ncbi:hypothetical protein GCM10027342_15850 [Photobacterium alginatilyticum]
MKFSVLCRFGVEQLITGDIRNEDHHIRQISVQVASTTRTIYTFIMYGIVLYKWRVK